MKSGMVMRQIANQEIIDLLIKFFEKNPDMRFIQGLWALGIVNKQDRFYEESVDTLKYAKNEKNAILTDDDFNIYTS